jgi:hypothetical protein
MSDIPTSPNDDRSTHHPLASPSRALWNSTTIRTYTSYRKFLGRTPRQTSFESSKTVVDRKLPRNSSDVRRVRDLKVNARCVSSGRLGDCSALRCPTTAFGKLPTFIDGIQHMLAHLDEPPFSRCHLPLASLDDLLFSLPCSGLASPKEASDPLRVIRTSHDGLEIPST